MVPGRTKLNMWHLPWKASLMGSSVRWRVGTRSVFLQKRCLHLGQDNFLVCRIAALYFAGHLAFLFLDIFVHLLRLFYRFINFHTNPCLPANFGHYFLMTGVMILWEKCFLYWLQWKSNALLVPLGKADNIISLSEFACPKAIYCETQADRLKNIIYTIAYLDWIPFLTTEYHKNQ